MNIPQDNKTQYLLRISFPMMLSWLSCVLMVFVDRMFLANFSKEALAAAVAAGMSAWTFTFAAQTLAELSEIYVAQYNGAGKFEKLGACTWQMLYVAAFSILLFTPLAFLGESFYQNSINGLNKANYFKWLTLAGPFNVVLGSLMGFFVGQGKTFIITKAFILGNLVNVILDPLFIFGFEPILDSHGITGAAIATNIGLISQCLYLAYFFFSKENKEKLGTAKFSFRPSLLKADRKSTRLNSSH